MNKSALVTLLLASLASTAAAQQTTALVGATIIDGTGAAPLRDGVIVVRGDRLACVGTRAQCAVPRGARTVNVAGKWITPGIVDAHVHYSQTGWADGRPDSYDARERFPYTETIAKLRDTRPFYRSNLCSGVTATFDVGGFPWTWSLKSSAENDPNAPHVAAAGPLLSTRDHWLNVPGERQFLHIGSDSAVRAGAQYLVANRTDAIKIWYLVGSSSADTAMWRSRLAIAAEEAKRAGIPLIVHATGLWAAKAAAAAGAHLLVHGVTDRPVDDEFIALARAAGTIYTPTLVVNDGYRQLRARNFQPDRYEMQCVDPVTRAKAFLTDSLPGRPNAEAVAAAEERAQRQFALEADNLRRVHAAGIPVAMGTDAGNPLTLHGPSVFLEMEALARAGLSPMQVIVSATRVGATAMRHDGIGTLANGKVADLVVLDADPLADIRNMRRIAQVMRAGMLRSQKELAF